LDGHRQLITNIKLKALGKAEEKVKANTAKTDKKKANN
jgi:hypothetical protein